MVLNLLRVEEINPEYMLERSFYQFQNNSAIPSLEKCEPFLVPLPALLKSICGIIATKRGLMHIINISSTSNRNVTIASKFKIQYLTTQ